MIEPDSARRPFGLDLAVVLGASLGARLVFLAVMPASVHSIDADHWFDVFQVLQAGHNPYEATTYLNWPPFWMQLIYLMGKAAGLLHVSFLRVLQTVLIVAESLMIAVVLHLVRELVPRADARRIVLWGLALNPVAILLTCQHANFDVIVALWIVLFATSLVRFHGNGEPTDWLAASLFLGLGIATKTVPFVLAPLLAHRWRSLSARTRWLGAALVVGPVLLGMSVIYVLAPQGVTANVLRYRSLGGWFGISGFLHIFGLSRLDGLHGMLFDIVLLGTMGGVGLMLVRERELSELGGLELVLIAALLLVMVPTLGPGYGPQYLEWSLPLLVVLYGAYDAPWRRVLGLCAIVAAITYVVEYALFPSHGWFLANLTQGSATVLAWSRVVSTQTGQTLVRLPLFAALLALLGGGVRVLRGAEARPLPGGTSHKRPR